MRFAKYVIPLTDKEQNNAITQSRRFAQLFSE